EIDGLHARLRCAHEQHVTALRVAQPPPAHRRLGDEHRANRLERGPQALGLIAHGGEQLHLGTPHEAGGASLRSDRRTIKETATPTTPGYLEYRASLRSRQSTRENARNSRRLQRAPSLPQKKPCHDLPR